MKLKEALAQFARWLANGSSPWAAYRAFMSNRLCGLDKCPGVRPLGIGEVYRRLWECILDVAGHEAKTACGKDQLCAGLEGGIDGAVHAMSSLWDYNEDDNEWGIFIS